MRFVALVLWTASLVAFLVPSLGFTSAGLERNGRVYLADFVEGQIEERVQVALFSLDQTSYRAEAESKIQPLFVEMPQLARAISFKLDEIHSKSPVTAELLLRTLTEYQWKVIEASPPFSSISWRDDENKTVFFYSTSWDLMDLANQTGVVFHEVAHVLAMRDFRMALSKAGTEEPSYVKVLPTEHEAEMRAQIFTRLIFSDRFASLDSDEVRLASHDLSWMSYSALAEVMSAQKETERLRTGFFGDVNECAEVFAPYFGPYRIRFRDTGYYTARWRFVREERAGSNYGARRFCSAHPSATVRECAFKEARSMMKESNDPVNLRKIGKSCEGRSGEIK